MNNEEKKVAVADAFRLANGIIGRLKKLEQHVRSRTDMAIGRCVQQLTEPGLEHDTAVRLRGELRELRAAAGTRIISVDKWTSLVADTLLRRLRRGEYAAALELIAKLEREEGSLPGLIPKDFDPTAVNSLASEFSRLTFLFERLSLANG